MRELFNIYCDESCHLEHDKINTMGIGGVWCPQLKIKEINERIVEIKNRNGVSIGSEIKWSKVSSNKRQLYLDLVNYFFDSDYLNFRGLVIPDKGVLNHILYCQTHDEWYYKIYFDMLKAIFDPMKQYKVYIDIKDTHSGERIKKLHDVCCNSFYDFSHDIISNIYAIQSYEVQIMQLIDILLGAVVYANRLVYEDEGLISEIKREIVELIKRRSGYNLLQTTLLRENKFNILVWESRNSPNIPGSIF